VHDDAFAGRPALMDAEILVGVERALPMKHADLFARMLASGGTIITGQIFLFTMLSVLLPMKIWASLVAPVIPMMMRSAFSWRASFSRPVIREVSSSANTDTLISGLMDSMSILRLSSPSSIIFLRPSWSLYITEPSLPASILSNTWYNMIWESGTFSATWAANRAAFLEVSEKSLGTINVFIR